MDELEPQAADFDLLFVTETKIRTDQGAAKAATGAAVSSTALALPWCDRSARAYL